MKTSALRKAAKAKSNGNGNGKKKKTGDWTTKIAWLTVPKPNVQDFKTFSKDKKGRPTKKTDWKAYSAAEEKYKRSQERGKTKKD